MDVTIDNFGEVCAFIEKQLLPKTNYIAYDLEFTGLKFERFERDRINYLPYQKYEKLKYVAQTFQIVQLGLSFVVVDQVKKVYPFNFYLFPRKPILYDRNLTMQLNCVNFNAENGMDWNKWINKGINYIKLSEVKVWQQRQKSKVSDMMIVMNSAGEREAQDFMRFCEDVANQEQGFSCDFQMTGALSEKLLKEMFIKLINSKKYNLSMKVELKKKRLVVTRVTEAERKQFYQKWREEVYGFSQLWRKIWGMKVPFVGHNCFLDLLYLYHNFVDNLPPSYFMFKNILVQTQMSFFDTKYIATKFPEISVKGTTLQKLVQNIPKALPNLVQLQMQQPYSRYSLEDPSLHEAGYDSFVTAWVYQQARSAFVNLDDKCLNKLNLNYSFFFINLRTLEDEINPYVTSILLSMRKVFLGLFLMAVNLNIRELRDCKL